MSKIKKLKKKFKAFVSELSPDEVREQLALAYLQMELCQQVLRGEDVEPVAMKDNGLSSDLELFYLCKKKAEELALLEKEKEKCKAGRITFTAEIDTSGLERDIDKIKKTFEKFKDDIGADKFSKMCEELCRERKSLFDPIEPISEHTANSLDDALENVAAELEKSKAFANELFKEKPSKQTLDAIRKYARERKTESERGFMCGTDGVTVARHFGESFVRVYGISSKEWKQVCKYIAEMRKKDKPKPKFKVGDEVYTMCVNDIEKMKVSEVTDGRQESFRYILSKGTLKILRPENDVFATIEELLNHLKENVNGEKE